MDKGTIPASWPLSPQALQRWNQLSQLERGFVEGCISAAVAAAETALELAASIRRSNDDYGKVGSQGPAAREKAAHLQLVPQSASALRQAQQTIRAIASRAAGAGDA